MKIYYNVCNKYRKSKNPEISLGIFIIYSKCDHEHKK